MIRWIDRELYNLLPNEYYSLIHNATDGISEDEAELLIKRVTPLINNVVNIPILTEDMESKVIEIILGLIIKGMIKGLKLEDNITK